MPPEESTPQPSTESPTPAIEARAPAPEPVSTSTDPGPVPEMAQPTTPTAQIPPNEPIAPEPEPFDPAEDRPTPEPPRTAVPAQTGLLHTARDLLNKARVAIKDRKRKKLEKILEFLNAKAKNGSTGSPQVTNDEVEKLLHVSDATATRYLSVLEKEGKIQQVGKTGRAVQYTRI